MIYYIVKGKGGSTTIPCMNTLWYKGLTLLLIAQAFVMFLVTALETTILPTGEIMTYNVPPPP
jgi:hypothetical protein